MIERDDIDRCAPERLAELMGAGLRGHDWDSDELAAVLRQQLDVPVSFDLGGLSEEAARQMETLCQTEGLVLRSLSDLFSHPHPPVDLLELTKRYAKACRQDVHGPIPEEIAVVLYFVSVCTALVKCHKRITELDNMSLSKGIRQVLRMSWLDGSLRDLLQRALDHLDAEEPGR